MSYCRFIEADVYVYLDVSGYLCCCGCSLSDKWSYLSTEDMVNHLKEHQAKGHEVPDYSFEGLEEDREENDKWMVDVTEGMCPTCNGDGKCRACLGSGVWNPLNEGKLEPCYLCVELYKGENIGVCESCEGKGKWK